MGQCLNGGGKVQLAEGWDTVRKGPDCRSGPTTLAMQVDAKAPKPRKPVRRIGYATLAIKIEC